jgi:hypothetical protein
MRAGTKLIICVLAGIMVTSLSCRKEADEPKNKVDSIKFAENKVVMYVDDIQKVELTINPPSARKDVKVEYSVTQKGVIEIDQNSSSKDGVVFKAVAPGSMVVVGKAGNAVDYISITVIGEGEPPIPYITLTDSVLEIPVGTKKHVVATLQGGTPADQNNFNFSCDNERYVFMEFANNTAIFEGLTSGSARVTVTHPKAQYSVDVVTFVLNDGEIAKYISGENVVFMELGGSPREYPVHLVNVDESYTNHTIYQIVEGNEIVSVKGVGPSCTLEAKAAGVAKIRVTNQAVEYPFEFQVVVKNSRDVSYIVSQKSVYIINNTDYVNVGVDMEGDVPSGYLDHFSYRLTDEARQIIEVQQLKDMFIVQGLRNGKAILTVDNKYSAFPCEILFVVQTKNTLVSQDGMFIKTSQSVIQMEVGKNAPDAILKMELIGGTSADQNNFEWVVEDSSIIDVKAPGRVRYARAQTDTIKSFEAEAIITAKKVGTTRITVYNPNAINDVTVMVKVYPYGTFNGQNIVLGGPSIIRLKEGEQTEVYTPVVSGNASLLGNTTWESENTAIAEVFGSFMHGMVKGVNNASGVTKLVVSGEHIAQSFESLIVVYTDETKDSIPYVYADNLFYEITVGQTIRIPLRHPNIPINDFHFEVNTTNKESLYYVVSGDVIIVSGASEGSGELFIKTLNSQCNDLNIFITVHSDKLDLAHPYTLTGSNFAGTDVGGVVSYTVTMTGAGPAELKNLIWSIDDGSIARVKAVSGNEAHIEGLHEGQTTLRINHGKSINEKAVMIYVVPTGESIDGKIIIGVEKANHVLLVNQSVFIRILTNASEKEKTFFDYTTINGDNIDIDFNYDTLVVTGLREGNSKITIFCKENNSTTKKNLVDLDLFFTVKSELGIKAELSFPDSVVVVKNKFKIITGSAVGINSFYLSKILYDFEDSTIASRTASGLEVTLRGLQVGQTFMTVTCDQLSYFKKILVICVEHEDDIDQLFYCTVPQTLYRIKKGDEIRVNLGFGINGPPDGTYDWKNINSNDAVIVAPISGGKSARIIGKNEGQAVIQITSDATPHNKPVEIIVEVSDIITGSDFYRFFLKKTIVQMSSNTSDMLPVSIYYGNEYYDDYDELKPGIRMEQGYSGITVTVSDESVLKASMAGENGQSLRISAEQPGRAEIILSHDLIAESAHVLVVVYSGEVPSSDEEFIFYVPQKHFLFDPEETKIISVQTNTDHYAAQEALTWLNQNPELFTIDAADKVNVRVTALKEGSGTLTIRDTSGVVETIYISVSGRVSVNTVTVATESIIVLSLEDSDAGGYTTRIMVSGGNDTGIHWYSTSNGIISIMENGTSCVLNPLSCGFTDLIVSGYGFTKTIVVKVVATEAEKQRTLLMNIDQRSFRLKKGDTIVLNPYYKVIKPPVNSVLQVKPTYDNKVAAWNMENDALAITAKNIGIEHLILHNSASENEIEIMFEVEEILNGTVSDTKNIVYMTTDIPVIILEPNSASYPIHINLIGQYTGSEGDFKWSCDSPLIHLTPMGSLAFMNTGSKEGKAVITVRNDFCTEPLLTINVIISVKYLEQTITDPYLYTDRTVYSMNISDSSMLIPMEIRNLNHIDYNLVQIEPLNGVIQTSFANGTIIVNALTVGTGQLQVRYAGLDLKLYVLVRESDDNEAVYLTTAQNYVIINENGTRGINVELVNYTELDYTKISWKSDNTSVAHVIGSGKTVQVLGTGVGVTKITAQHNKSYNKLDIIVKVLPAGSSEEICYLTTNSNVIETYVSTNSSQIYVNKIGGRTQDVDASWSVDNPSIVGVIGTNNMAYITAKKSGVAKITVSDREAGTLDIVVIVREEQPGSLIIVPNENIVQITPHSTNGVVSVSMIGIKESDEKYFKWEIFTQLPSDINVARNGGSVVSIYAMGTRATINGIYAGTARIRITHPKAAEAAYIVVQVTSFQSMQFGQTSVDIVKNDMTYVTLETPDYENFAGKIQFRTDNANVATVMGTHRVALVSAHDLVGKTTITAFIPDTDLKTTLTVNVKEEETYKEPIIITNQTMFMLNPVEKPFYVNASLNGFGVTEEDNDNLIWTLDYNDTERLSPILKIFPNNAKDEGFKSMGKSIMVEIQHRDKWESIEFCTITVSHSDTNHKRVLYFQIQEASNAFTISTKYIQMETGQSVELSCNILNGNSKDYEQVVWQAKKDDINPGKDIVKIMGRGKTIQLYATSDGYTTVTASFRGLGGLGTSCGVNVKSVYYFSISYQMITAYPGQKDQNGGVFQIKYTVRPFNAGIQWMNTDDSNIEAGKKVANVYFSAAENDGYGTGEGSIYFEFLKEGAFTLLGVSNQKMARVDIVVQNVFEFTIIPTDLYLQEVPYTFHNGGQNIAKVSKYRPDGLNLHTFLPIKDYGYEIKYMVKPAGSTIKEIDRKLFDNINIEGITNKCDNWVVTIEKPVIVQGIKAYGYIYIKNHTETMVDTEYGFEFKQYRPDGQPANTDTQIVRFTSILPPGEGRLVPVFERVRGDLSNSAGHKRVERYKDNYDAPVYYPVNKDAIHESSIKGNKSEYLDMVSDNYDNDYNKKIENIGKNEAINDRYAVDIYDGEEHYIILDSYNPSAVIEIGEITFPNDPLNENGTLNRGLSVQKVTLDEKNNLYALSISGGNDFVIYDGIASTYDLKMRLHSNFPNNSDYYKIHNDNQGYMSDDTSKFNYVHTGNIDDKNLYYYYNKYDVYNSDIVNNILNEGANHDIDADGNYADWHPHYTLPDVKDTLSGLERMVQRNKIELPNSSYPYNTPRSYDVYDSVFSSTVATYGYTVGTGPNPQVVTYDEGVYTVYVYDYNTNTLKRIQLDYNSDPRLDVNPIYAQFSKLEGYVYKLYREDYYTNKDWTHNPIQFQYLNFPSSLTYGNINPYDDKSTYHKTRTGNDYIEYILTNHDMTIYDHYSTLHDYTTCGGYVYVIHPVNHTVNNQLSAYYSYGYTENFSGTAHWTLYPYNHEKNIENNYGNITLNQYNTLNKNYHLFKGNYIRIGGDDSYYGTFIEIPETGYYIHNDIHAYWVKNYGYNWGKTDWTTHNLHTGAQEYTTNPTGIAHYHTIKDKYYIEPYTGIRSWYADVPFVNDRYNTIGNYNDDKKYVRYNLIEQEKEDTFIFKNYIQNKNVNFNKNNNRIKMINNGYYYFKDDYSQDLTFNEFSFTPRLSSKIYDIENNPDNPRYVYEEDVNKKYYIYNITQKIILYIDNNYVKSNNIYRWKNDSLLKYPFAFNSNETNDLIQLINHKSGNYYPINIRDYTGTTIVDYVDYIPETDVRTKTFDVTVNYRNSNGMTNQLILKITHHIKSNKNPSLSTTVGSTDGYVNVEKINTSYFQSSNGWKGDIFDSKKYPFERNMGYFYVHNKWK